MLETSLESLWINWNMNFESMQCKQRNTATVNP